MPAKLLLDQSEASGATYINAMWLERLKNQWPPYIIKDTSQLGANILRWTRNVYINWSGWCEGDNKGCTEVYTSTGNAMILH